MPRRTKAPSPSALCFDEAGLHQLAQIDAEPADDNPPHGSSHVPASNYLSLARMIETNGAGSLEDVPGFASYRARNVGLLPTLKAELVQPSRDDFVTENVIGHDDRVPISDTTQLPWRCISMLSITYEDGWRAIGTAWFLSAKALGTAGHNVFHPHHGKAREIIVTPGYNGVSAPFQSYVAAMTYCDPQWQRNADPFYDFGVVGLQTADVGKRLGWFGIAAYTDQQLASLLVNVSGYPTDKAPATQYYNGGRIEQTDDAFLLYSFDTEAGMSGAPIFALFGQQRIVVGIHTNGSTRANRARRIDATLFSILERFI